MRKIFAAVLLGLLILFDACPCKCESESESEIIIDCISVDETGEAEAVGHITEYTKNTQVTFLAMTAEANSAGAISGDTILYIDQKTVGNNGVFLMKFQVPSRFSKTETVFRFGTDSGAEAVTETLVMPKLPPGLENVTDNSVLYGCDVYTLDSVYLNGEYVLDSVIYGGNVIFFKIGGYWYDLLNERATSSAYLIPENAASDEEMNALELRYYYVRNKKAVFDTEGTK